MRMFAGDILPKVKFLAQKKKEKEKRLENKIKKAWRVEVIFSGKNIHDILPKTKCETAKLKSLWHAAQ